MTTTGLLIIIQSAAIVVLIILFLMVSIRLLDSMSEILKKVHGSRHFLSSDSGEKQSEEYRNLSEKINNLRPIVMPDSMPGVEQLADLAEAYWRLDKIYEKSKSDEDNNARSIKSALLQIWDFLDKNNIEITDYTGKQYNSGMNINARFVNKEEVKKPIIERTLSPEIRYRGTLYKQANVIVAISGDKE